MIAIGFAVAAAIGTLVRFVAGGPDGSVNRHVAATLTLNVLGAFLLGAISASGQSLQLIIGVGGLGSLTTFSTFVWQVEYLGVERGARAAAVVYLAGSAIAGVAAAWLGHALAG